MRTLTHQINQRKKHKKTCRGELKSDSSSEDSGVPLWRKEVTLIAMMNHPNCQNESGSNTPGDNNRNIALENEPSQIHITPGVESMVTASSSSEGEDPIGSGEAADEEAPEESNVIGPKEETETTPSRTPGVTGQKPGGEASEATKKGKFPKIMDDQPTKSVAAKSSEAAAKADVEVIDLTATSSEEADAKEPVEAGAENPEEGPMTTKEFLEKRAEMRRKEWTNAKEQVNMEKEQSGTETESEPEPVMFTGITFNGPPLFGPLRAESMPAKLMASENAGSAGKAMRDKIRAMMPVCYMMNEAPSAGDIPETPMPPPVQHPSDEEDYAMMMFYVYACASNGKPFPPATPVRYPMFLDETMKRGLFRELKYDFPLEHGQWQVMVKGKALKKEDTPHSLGIEADETVVAKLMMHNVAPSPATVQDPSTRHSDEEDDRDTGAAAASAATSTLNAPTGADEPAAKAGPDVSLEVWRGQSEQLHVRWGRHRQMWRLLSALSAMCKVQDHHIILKTDMHITSGVGCVMGSDSPHTLSLKNNDRLHIHHLPNDVQITSHFTPSLAVAKRILTISGYRIHIDQEIVGGRRGMDKGKGSVRSTQLTLINQKSTQNNTEIGENSISLTSNTSRNKRKSRLPVRIGEVKRKKTPLTLPHMRSKSTNTLSPKITKVTEMTESYQDETQNVISKSTIPEECDNENSQLPRIRLVRIRNDNIRPRRDRRQNIDLGRIVENIVKTQNLVKFEEHTSDYKSQSSPLESQSESDPESEDLLKPGFQRITIMTSQGPITRQYDQNKTVYTPDMRYPYRKSVKSGPDDSCRDESPTVTNDEITPENNSSNKKNLEIDCFSPNSLSTKVETSDSESETEGSLPEVNTEPRFNLHKETTMVTKQNKKKRKSQRQRRRDRKRSMYSETKRYRLLQTYLLVMDCHGKMRRVKAALDTQSNVSYAKKYLGQKRE